MRHFLGRFSSVQKVFLNDAWAFLGEPGWYNALESLVPTKIRSLSIRNVKRHVNNPGNDYLAPLAVFKGLAELSFGPWIGRVSDVRALAGLKTLTKLNLRGIWESVDDAAFSSLAVLTNLTALSLKECEYLSENGFKTLLYFSALTALDIGGTIIDDELSTIIIDDVLGILARLTGLTQLDMSDIDSYRPYGPPVIDGIVYIEHAGIRQLVRSLPATTIKLTSIHFPFIGYYPDITGCQMPYR
jgi:hypothetical protein